MVVKVETDLSEQDIAAIVALKRIEKREALRILKEDAHRLWLAIKKLEVEIAVDEANFKIGDHVHSDDYWGNPNWHRKGFIISRIELLDAKVVYYGKKVLKSGKPGNPEFRLEHPRLLIKGKEHESVL